MSRRNRRGAGASPPPLFGGALSHVEHAGRQWAVRSVSGSAASKTYRCPGCNQEIRAGTSHVVVWPVGEAPAWQGHEPEGGDERRHWHTGCWHRES